MIILKEVHKQSRVMVHKVCNGGHGTWLQFTNFKCTVNNRYTGNIREQVSNRIKLNTIR